ncbi:MAG TPA: formylmethanofuran dehydrogenase subunit E family protein [Deltaproteobacteria bacterium]|nr:formylmethanofuran dehydrogenase subunit E family protein [Deltaproteobacteria bacterium]
MHIGPYTFEEYLDRVKAFHGSIAPGMIAGGIMVDIARRNLPEGEFFDVICESGHCLPDAVQLLTPCTIGNGWLKIISTSRYALTFYNKYTGEGIRVYLDAKKLGDCHAVRSWFLREKPKHEQDLGAIIDEFKKAGTEVIGTQKVQVKQEFLQGAKKKHGAIILCPSCGEAFRSDFGEVCPGCRGGSPYDT